MASMLRRWMAAEAGPGRLLPWLPVAFGCGIAAYFAAEHEPVPSAAAALAAGLVVLCIVLRRSRGFAALALAAAVAAGFACAALKTARVAHGVLARPVFGATVKGFVESREERERSDRFVLRVTDIDVPRREVLLDRVRLSVKKGTAPAVGSFIEAKARLRPPLSPLRPGSYDFARDLYFQGIGATGFVTGQVRAVPAPGDGGWWLRYAATLQNMRDAIDARIRASLTGDARAIATALLTGRRDALSTPVNDALFISGLGHVLSISGYHMAVVAGAVFFALRALLALSPTLVAGYPIKKWSAAVALVAAAFYLLLSGAEVATQRSFLMTGVVLIAVMADRRAITFRTLAIAAMIVLVVAPEALVHPSFQMSFAATLGLVALIAQGMPALFARSESSAVARFALWGGREVMMLALASTIAGLATLPYAAFHFHRVTPYGLLANVAAMPVVSAVVMPAGLLGLLAMPFGFDGVFWRVMEAGIDWMVVVSQWVAALPGAVGRVAAFGTGPLALASLGIVVLGLLKSPLRLAGAVLLAMAAVWVWQTEQPDVLVSADGRHVAVRGPEGRLAFMQAGKDAFLTKEWLAADADPRGAGDPVVGAAISCDDAGCIAPLRDGGYVALGLQADAYADDCRRALVMVVRGQPPGGCRALVINQASLRSSGALALRRTAAGFVRQADKPAGWNRPWSPGALSEQGADVGAPASGRAPDATPPEASLED
jgi:competence protein ComEC